MKKRLLVVDDEAVIRDVVRDALAPEYDVAGAPDAPGALLALVENVPDVLVTDVRMPGGGSMDLVQKALARFPDLAVVVITGFSTREDFIGFHRLGIADYLRKPFTPVELRRSVIRALETRRHRAENALLRSALAPPRPVEMLVGESPAMLAVKIQIARVAPTGASVLITGNSGTGKELVARALHALSPRAQGPFVPVHCGALPQDLIDSELFGHVRGAFTGADRARAGRFEDADGGTLFLDEVGTMSEATQVRLLRVLAEREFSRVGENVVRTVDVRVVAATNVSLSQLSAQGRFREDLHYRLNVFPIALPDLRDRPGDMPVLAAHCLRRACERLGRSPLMLSQAAVRLLSAHSWPGNVRELENEIERAAILAQGPVIEKEQLLLSRTAGAPPSMKDLPREGVDLPRLLEDVERDLVRQALGRTGGSRQQAAQLLGIQRTTLAQKLRRWGEADDDDQA